MFGGLVLIMLLAHPQTTWLDAYRKGFQIPEKVDVTGWADSKRILPDDSNQGGRYSSDKTPYMKEIGQALSPGSGYQFVTFMKSTQVGGSAMAENLVGHTIDTNPRPILYLLPNNVLSGRVSNQRIAPMIEMTEALRNKVVAPNSKDGVNTIKEKEFAGGRLLFGNATAPNDIRQFAGAIIIFDECDAYEVTKEGEVIPIALKRAITFGKRKKIFYISTPLLKGFSRIEAAYEDSDQRRYHIHCPNCGYAQTFEWERFRKVPNNVFMRCNSCNQEIYEHHKTMMLENGLWIPKCHEIASLNHFTYNGREFQEGHNYFVDNVDLEQLLSEELVKDIPQTKAGFHINALYSPLGWYSWEEAVKEYLKAEKSGEAKDKQVFENTILARTYEDDSIVTKPEELLARRENYCVGNPDAQAPREVVLITCGVDTQDDRLEAVIVGWGAGQESWVIEHAVFEGDPDEPSSLECPNVWDELDDYLDSTFLLEDGRVMSIKTTCIDSGGSKTQSV